MHQSRLKGEVHVFRAVIWGRFPEGDQPTPETLALKVGARVMTLTNKRSADGEIEYVNGEIGVIEAMDDGENAVVHVRLDRGPTVSIQRTKWSKYEYESEFDANTGKPIVRQREVGTFVQIPLKLAYAVTIHKSQGLTLDCVEVKLGDGCFASGQLYTALSRCRNIDNLRIDRAICPADANLDQAVVDFYREVESGHQPKSKRKDATSAIPERPGKCPQRKTPTTDKIPDYYSEDDGTEPIEKKTDPRSGKNRIATNSDIDHLLIVYRNQNADEKSTKMTKRLNGIGFNKMDAPVLTELAEKYLDNGNLTKDELETVHRLIAKYRRQWA